ncbi:MAG TPA: Cu(I)-responsive transcriptional regulator [Burkholderiaceae bacterium]
MNIGEASQRSAVSAKMIRHYESLGLLPPVARTPAGYRQYDDATVHALRFIRRARDLGFGMHEIEALLGLWHDRRRASAQVKRIALDHAADLQRRIEAMQAMQRTLEHLARGCAGDDRPDCPILDDLAGQAPAPAPTITESATASPSSGRPAASRSSSRAPSPRRG